MHRIAFEMGEKLLSEARTKRQSLDTKERVRQLRDELRPKLGDVDPAPAPKAEQHWDRALNRLQVEAVSLTVEEGIQVPLLLLLPQSKPAGVVVAVAQGGKERFLTDRAAELAALLQAGVAVCLPDLRGTGETASDREEYPYGGNAQQQFDLSRNLLGSRVKDLRTVLNYLRARESLRGARIAVWGESFAAQNPTHLYLDEVEYESGPQVQRRADPTGAHVALLTALYEDDVQAVAARGGLAGYLSVLENAFTYIPMDVVILGVLKAGDIADIAGALAPRPVVLADLVDGRNVPVQAGKLEKALAPARDTYGDAGASKRLSVTGKMEDVAGWLISQLR
jgi:hypothetical protein